MLIHTMRGTPCGVRGWRWSPAKSTIASPLGRSLLHLHADALRSCSSRLQPHNSALSGKRLSPWMTPYQAGSPSTRQDRLTPICRQLLSWRIQKRCSTRSRRRLVVTGTPAHTTRPRLEGLCLSVMAGWRLWRPGPMPRGEGRGSPGRGERWRGRASGRSRPFSEHLAPSGRTLLISDVPDASPTVSSHL